MTRRLLSLLAITLVAASCGTTTTKTVVVTTTAPPSTTTRPPVSPAPMSVVVYRVVDGALQPELAKVPRTSAVATATLGALDVGAPVTIADGTATVDLPKATQEKQAEVVYTLTRFRDVKRVDVAGRTGLTRDDFGVFLPPILVESPVAGATVPRTFHLSGTASVFEATLSVELRRDGKLLEKRTVTASEGAPGRGDFDATFTATPGRLAISVFAPSAANGSPQHQVLVVVTVI